VHSTQVPRDVAAKLKKGSVPHKRIFLLLSFPSRERLRRWAENSAFNIQAPFIT
jgi:hypothetical protein